MAKNHNSSYRFWVIVVMAQTERNHSIFIIVMWRSGAAKTETAGTDGSDGSNGSDGNGTDGEKKKRNAREIYSTFVAIGFISRFCPTNGLNLQANYLTGAFYIFEFRHLK